jgi:hypothetical protein
LNIHLKTYNSFHFKKQSTNNVRWTKYVSSSMLSHVLTYFFPFLSPTPPSHPFLSFPFSYKPHLLLDSPSHSFNLFSCPLLSSPLPLQLLPSGSPLCISHLTFLCTSFAPTPYSPSRLSLSFRPVHLLLLCTLLLLHASLSLAAVSLFHPSHFLFSIPHILVYFPRLF